MSFTIQSIWFYLGLIPGVNLARISATKGCPNGRASGWSVSDFPGALGNLVEICSWSRESPEVITSRRISSIRFKE